MAFYPCANLIDLVDGYKAKLTVNGKKLLFIHDGGQSYCIEDRCPHMDAPLATGEVSGGAIRCRAHGIAFSLSSGKAEGPLADSMSCLTFYPISYDGNKVGIEL